MRRRRPRSGEGISHLRTLNDDDDDEEDEDSEKPGAVRGPCSARGRSRVWPCRTRPRRSNDP